MTSESMDELVHLEQLTALLQRRRRILEIQRTRFGELAPASIVMELEDTERQLAQIQADVRRLRPIPTDTTSPYLGLLTFQEDDTIFFFGRDALIGELLTKSEQTSFLAVLGPSGSGKSSVVRAGLIPALKRGALPGSEQWLYLAPLKPGARPLNALAAALAAAQAGKLGDIAAIRETLSKQPDALLLLADGLLSGQTNARLVLVVDQAEELWTLAPIEPAARATFAADQQQPFINCLLAAVQAPDHPVLIILTMRADFLHRALEHQGLATWTKTHHVLVEPLTRDELRSAILRPAELVGGGFEPGLVDTLVEQTASQPGALPLLEYTLLELWKERGPEGTLTWEAFKRIGGGVEGGLARRADTVLTKQYTAEQQAELRAVLLRLVQPGEGAVDTRRRVPLDDLVPAGSSSEAVQALLKPLADERLITTGYNPETNEEFVEVSHEALIRAWPTLGEWISMARGDLRLQIQLGEAARDWVTSSEKPDLLWSGLRLDTAESWLDRARPRLNVRDQRFLDASRTHRQVALEAEQARLTAEEAARQRELEQARALAAGSIQLRRRALYLVGALIASLIAAASAGWYWYRATAATQDAYRSAQAADQAEQRAFAQLLVAQGQTVYNDHPLLGVRLAVEGLTWLPEKDPAHSDLFNIATQLIKQGRLQKLASDGTGLVAAPDNTTFILIRANSPSELRRTTDGTIIATLESQTTGVWFSPDSRLIAVAYTNTPSELRRADGSLVTPLVGTAKYVWFSSDSTLFVVAYADKPAELRRANGSLVTVLADTADDVTFSPNSALFFVRYVDFRRPIELRRADGSLISLTGDAYRVVFSPDSSPFVVQYNDKPGELWRADGSLISLTGRAYDVTFSPDSTHFMVLYDGKPAEQRRADGGLITTFTDVVRSVSYSPDGTHFVVRYDGMASNGKPLELRRADGSLVALTNLAGQVRDISFSPDGSLLIVHYVEKPAELRRADGSLITSLTGIIYWTFPIGVVDQAEPDNKGIWFSPDGTLFVVEYLDKPSELRRADGSLVSTLAGTANAVTFNSDSHLFVVRYRAKPGELWETQGSIWRLTTFTNLNTFVYDPKAIRMVVQDSTGQVYTVATDWLKDVADYADKLSEVELTKRTCTGLIAHFDEKELQPYLGNRTSRGCRFS